ncbi:hypothetical protein PoB_005276200 [Plakobranchus ocellatus]|uniref:Uncharacterized protein n=1 Tax=Plakobranchus ocellatus TaxID=259542 RepID=A0AAV4C4G4_9GAST|nr:hypothetical protein PoB_005276200 [Plakobranchus ocellatus]
MRLSSVKMNSHELSLTLGHVQRLAPADNPMIGYNPRLIDTWCRTKRWRRTGHQMLIKSIDQAKRRTVHRMLIKSIDQARRRTGLLVHFIG